MTMIVRKMPPPRTSALRYHTRDERIAMVAPLLDARPAGDTLAPHEKRGVSRLHGVSVRTVERAVVDWASPAPAPRAFTPPRELLVRTAMHAGNLRRASTELRLEGVQLPSYPTLARAIGADPGLRLVLHKGMKALEHYVEVGVFEPDHRNELWFMDAMHVPIRCRTAHGGIVDDLWLLSAFEAYSRTCLAHVLTIGAPDSSDAVDVFLSAVLGRVFTRDDLEAWRPEILERLAPPAGNDPRPYLVGGVPDALMTDNGSIFTSDEFRAGVHDFVPTGHVFSEPYISALRGKQERWHRTSQVTWLAGLPGYTDGPKPFPGTDKDRPYAVPPDEHLPRVEAVMETLDWAIDAYNRTHEVSTTGEVPLARFLTNRTPLRRVEPISFWHDMPTLGEFQVQPRGVHVDGMYRAWTGRGALIGKAVEARGFPGQPGRVFVGQGNAFIAEAIPHAARTEDECNASGTQNALRERTARSVLREAGDRLMLDGLPAADVPPSVAARAAARAAAKVAPLADPAAVLRSGPDGSAPTESAA